MTAPTVAEWTGLCLATESNLPHEWPYIVQVLKNRAAHPRWPDTVLEVILQPSQFSHFNPFQGLRKELSDEELYAAVVRGRANYGRVINKGLLALAVEAAQDLLATPAWRAPFGPKVCFYYSPISMQPNGKEPWWWKQEVRRAFTPDGVDPWRFVYGEMG